MLLFKGTLLGITIFLLFSLAYVFHLFGGLGKNTAMGVNAIKAYTIHNVTYWLLLVGAVIIGNALIRLWQK